ncbi:HET-domain-containing protein [Xylariaceae sp. FL0016]|nr:HET-domain-containing protein [Xylariaceae sp. FL0016]
MRLIHCRTLEFEEFVQHAPPYAVLSHTWGEDEVTFGDMSDRKRASQKEGYHKIQWTCRLALEEDIEYAWVDTCCIDKSSSAELSEAINSMFAWYRNSTVCYVWLSDFTNDPELRLTDKIVSAAFEARESVEQQEGTFQDPPPLTTREISMRDRVKKGVGKCRWFSRGWTLQELIAPKDVKFYDKEWNFYGSKMMLAPILSWITGIDSAVLKGGPLHEVLVGRRMSWASNRQTRRIEDMAYCLLGIFDINMPLLYGEGQKSFTRLQEEIIKSSNDLSIFAWTADLYDTRAFRGLWASSPDEFKSCQMLVKPSFEWNGRGGEYSITSQGLRTTDMIRIGSGAASRAGSYFLPLNCVDARQKKLIRFVSLRQYGPNLFVRLKPWLFDTVVDFDVYTASRLAQPQYILCKESPALQDTVLASRLDSIQIEFDTDIFDVSTIQAWPEADWDVRNSILLSYQRRQFWGTWKAKAIDGDDGISISCVLSNGFLLYGIFRWHDIPYILEGGDMLPSQVEDILRDVRHRTSAECWGFRHTVENIEHDLGEGDNSKVPCTKLRVRSERIDNGENGGRVRKRLHQLFKKRTWP